MGGQYNNITQTVIVTTIVTTVALVSTILYKKWKKQKIPSKWKQVGTVKKINLYPLKSGRRIELDRVEVTNVGLRQMKEDEKVFQLRDRTLMVYGAKDGEFRTARTYPKMVLIDVSVHDENHLAIDAPTMRTLYVKIPNKKDNPTTYIKCWSGEQIFGVDCGDEAATWFSRYIIERESGLRLAYHDISQKRDITKPQRKVLDYYKLLGNDSVGVYHDLTSILLINQASVNDLNEKIGNTQVSVENFRPNFLIDGPELEPFAEDNWDWISIGDVVCRNVKECTRCSMTTIDAETGVRNSAREPLTTLNKYRMTKGPEKSPVMGAMLGVRRPGFVKVGDPILIPVSE